MSLASVMITQAGAFSISLSPLEDKPVNRQK